MFSSCSRAPSSMMHEPVQRIPRNQGSATDVLKQALILYIKANFNDRQRLFFSIEDQIWKNYLRVNTEKELQIDTAFDPSQFLMDYTYNTILSYTCSKFRRTQKPPAMRIKVYTYIQGFKFTVQIQRFISPAGAHKYRNELIQLKVLSSEN